MRLRTNAYLPAAMVATASIDSPSLSPNIGNMSQSPTARPVKIDRILVVDDVPDNCFLTQTLLQQQGYYTDIAYSGSEALRYIETSPPDLLLLDIMMPGMDGYEVTRRIRQKTDSPFLPILLITAHGQPSVAQGLDMGADEFIRKPIELDELIARVRSLLRLKHSVDERDLIARQREDFVSRLTHDLRTPLVAADRMLTLFQEGALGALPPTMGEAIGTMIRSNQNLLTMVNLLLEVYRYEAGRKTLNFTSVDLPELVQAVIAELLPLATEKNLIVMFHRLTPENDKTAGIILGDRIELRRVITNLLGNAIKFTDAGSITVRLMSQSSKSQKDAIVLEIEDTGPGIPIAEQPKLFESFITGSHRRSGSGLGLHLVRQIVEAHRGQIDVQSEIGKGSLFTVCLPVSA